MAIPASGDQLGLSVLIVDVVFLTLATVAVCARLWARHMTKTKLCFNDYVIILGLMFAGGLETTAIMAVVTGGAGQHIDKVQPSQLVSVFKGYVAAEILWGTANTCVKLSILHLYVKLFPTRQFQIATYVLMGIVACFCIVVVVEALTVCRPFSYTWDKTIKGTCANELEIYLSSSIINLVIDISIILLPMPMLWKLRMPWSRKFALTFIFGLGAFICIVTILRIWTLKRFNELDFSYDLAKLAIWTDLEPTLGIINACLPIIRPVTQRLTSTTAYLWSALSSRTRFTTEDTPKDSSIVTFGRTGVKKAGAKRSGGFGKLDDAYPLTGITDVITAVSQVEGPDRPNSQPESESRDLEAQDNHGKSSIVRRIDVRKDWVVHSVQS